MSKRAEHEARIRALEEQIALRNAIIRLRSNADFKLVFEEAYLKKSALDYLANASNLAMSAEDRTDALEMAKAHGHTRNWLSIQIRMGNQAEDEVSDASEQADELEQIFIEDEEAAQAPLTDVDLPLAGE